MHGRLIWSQYFGDMPSSKFHIQSELARCLEDNDFRGFEDALESAVDIGYDLNESYGKEVGYKTILHLALDEDDHDTTRYIKVRLLLMLMDQVRIIIIIDRLCWLAGQAPIT